MRDDDRLLDVPGAEFGSGVVGVCDICGVRQAVVILTKERFKLCVLDFLNKTWVKTDRKPGAPAPAYRSDRVTFETSAVPSHVAPAITLSPTKVVRHPAVLIAPDVYGVTTTVLDAAIRFAREGFEVLVPDVGKTDGIGITHHAAMRAGRTFRGGVPLRSPKVGNLLALYQDAFRALLAREMVDPTRSAVFGSGYGGSLAVGFALESTSLSAVALAYPMPVQPAGALKLLTSPVLAVVGDRDRAARRAAEQLRGAVPPERLSIVESPGAGPHFLARDLSGYNVARAEPAWDALLAFLRARLLPPPPKPPAPPVRTVEPSVPAGALTAATSTPRPPPPGPTPAPSSAA